MLGATACTISVWSSHDVPFSSPADVVLTCSPILRCYGPKSSLSTWRAVESRTWRRHLQEVCQGGPLERPFSRSPEARKVAPWVQACLRSVHPSDLRHVVYRDAVKRTCACSVFRRVAATVSLNLVPSLHSLFTLSNQRYASITSGDHRSQGGKLQVLQHSTSGE